MEHLLEVSNLTITLKKGKQRLIAVEHVTFSLDQGKTLGIIGESGCGKSLTCSAILGLLDKKIWDVSGTVKLDGEELQIDSNKKMAGIRGNRMALIMQNPMSAFNPVITIGQHFQETVGKKGQEKRSKAEIDAIAVELLSKMHIRDPRVILKSYAFQLSGGMLQRIMIALALAVHPEILIADEPTTALDLSVQHEIIKILREMQKQYATSILIVSHDLAVISNLADDIAVMYAGDIVEKGDAKSILETARHPYTRGLFASRPAFSKDRLLMMEGQPPTLEERGAGCPFYPRCKDGCDACRTYRIPQCQISHVHEVHCRAWEGVQFDGAIGN